METPNVPVPPVNPVTPVTPPPHDKTFKWTIIAGGGLLLVGIFSYFLAGGGLFKGQLKLESKVITADQMTALGKCIDFANSNTYEQATAKKTVEEIKLMKDCTSGMTVSINAPKVVSLAHASITATPDANDKTGKVYNIIYKTYTTPGAPALDTAIGFDLGDGTKISTIDADPAMTKNADGTITIKHTYPASATYTIKSLQRVTGMKDNNGQPLALSATRDVTVVDTVLQVANPGKVIQELPPLQVANPGKVIQELPPLQVANPADLAVVALSNPVNQDSQISAAKTIGALILNFSLKDSNKATAISKVYAQVDVTDPAKIADITNIKLSSGNAPLGNVGSVPSSGSIEIDLNPSFALGLGNTTTLTLSADVDASAAGTGTYKFTVTKVEFIDADGNPTSMNATSLAGASVIKTVKALTPVPGIGVGDIPAPNQNGDVIVSFNDLSQNTNLVKSWSWDFGDGTAPAFYIAYNSNPVTHTFTPQSVDKTYPVSLTLTDSNKTPYVITKQVLIPAVVAQKADLSVTPSTSWQPIAGSINVQFFDKTTPTANEKSAVLDCGLGSGGSTQTISTQVEFTDAHNKGLLCDYASANPVPAAGAKFSITYTVTDTAGKVYDPITTPYVIPAIADSSTADFSIDMSDTKDTYILVSFVDKSSPQDQIKQWDWDFGNPENKNVANTISQPAPLTNPPLKEQHPYLYQDAPKSYPVKLTVTFNSGVVKTITKNVDMPAKPSASAFLFADVLNSDLLTDSFAEGGGKGDGQPGSESFSYGDGMLIFIDDSQAVAKDALGFSAGINYWTFDEPRTDGAVLPPAPQPDNTPQLSFTISCKATANPLEATCSTANLKLGANTNNIANGDWIFDGDNTTDTQAIPNATGKDVLPVIYKFSTPGSHSATLSLVPQLVGDKVILGDTVVSGPVNFNVTAPAVQPPVGGNSGGNAGGNTYITNNTYVTNPTPTTQAPKPTPTPDQGISRFKVIPVINTAPVTTLTACLQDTKSPISFDDTVNSTYRFLSQLKSKDFNDEIFHGYKTDGKVIFDPSKPISLAEYLKTIVYMSCLKYQPSTTDKWYSGIIKAAQDKQLIGLEDPEQQVNIRTALEILYKAAGTNIKKAPATFKQYFADVPASDKDYSILQDMAYSNIFVGKLVNGEHRADLNEIMDRAAVGSFLNNYLVTAK